MLDLSLSDFLQFVMAMRSGMLFHTLNHFFWQGKYSYHGRWHRWHLSNLDDIPDAKVWWRIACPSKIELKLKTNYFAKQNRLVHQQMRSVQAPRSLMIRGSHTDQHWLLSGPRWGIIMTKIGYYHNPLRKIRSTNQYKGTPHMVLEQVGFWNTWVSGPCLPNRNIHNVASPMSGAFQVGTCRYVLCIQRIRGTPWELKVYILVDSVNDIPKYM